MWATGEGRAFGFTLLELLVVLAIVALVSVAIPMALPHLVPAQQLRADSESLAASLREVRAEATVEQGPVSLEVHATERSVDRGNRGVLWRASREVTVTWNSYGISPTLRFFPDGSSSGGTILLRFGARQVAVEVSPMTGRIRVVAP